MTYNFQLTSALRVTDTCTAVGNLIRLSKAVKGFFYYFNSLITVNCHSLISPGVYTSSGGIIIRARGRLIPGGGG